jgi:hypothetical protein
MKRPAWALFTLMTFTAIALACTKIPTGEDSVLSFTVNPLPSPSVVVGDTLRDTLGVVSPISVSAFNFQGGSVPSPRVRFSTGDRGIHVDSVSGIVTGDSVRTGARIVVSVGAVQAPVQIGVALRPDSIAPLNARDSLLYSLTDTTLNVSNAMGVTLLHGKGTDSVVVGYYVSFRLIRPAGTVAQLVNDNGAVGTTADTTDASGNATRRIKLNVAQLTSAADSVIVLASASYKGTAIRGSPVRLVLRYRLK